MKKIASILMAVLVVIGMFAFTASAAEGPTFTLKADKTTAAVGDEVTITVSVSENSKLCAIDLEVNYDAQEFEFVSYQITEGNNLMAEINNVAGRLIYTAAATSNIKDDKPVLFTAKFKVLKAGGTFALDIVAAYAANGENKEIDYTAKAEQNSVNSNVTVACPHANKDTVKVDSTCKVKGSETVKCADCGEVISTKELPLADHKFAETTVTKEPTCTEAGESTGTCTVCGETAKNVIPATGHNHVEDKAQAVAPTCTEDGKVVKVCACGDTVTEAVAATGHKAGDWETVTEATNTTAGKKVKKCTVCKEVVDTKAIPAHGSQGGAGTAEKPNIPDTDAGVSMMAFAVAGLAAATGAIVRKRRSK